MLFKEFVKINPKVELETGKTYPYVGMADVNPSRGYVENSETREYNSSRSKFEEGDTLFARITPCLENGKIARFKSNGIKKGFGSTEFFVFRAKKGISDPSYVYYLSRSPLIRKTAEKSMAGASGRQRADITAVEEVEIDPPDLPTQKKIASILSAFDDLIENNSRRIEILEEMARRIYREWFVHFRYPGYQEDELIDSSTELGEIPEGWEVVEVQDIIDVNPRTSIDKDKKRPYLPMANVSENSMLIDDTDLEYRDGSGGSKFKNYDTLFARITPSLENGKTGFVQFLKSDKQIALGSTEFIVMRSKMLNPYFVYCLARDEQFRESAIKSMAGASGRQRVRIGTVKEFVVPFPPKNLLSKFKNIAEPMFKEVGVLSDQNNKLNATRDLLLPKLISGEINLIKYPMLNK